MNIIHDDVKDKVTEIKVRVLVKVITLATKAYTKVSLGKALDFDVEELNTLVKGMYKS
jgi:hypothetical protein